MKMNDANADPSARVWTIHNSFGRAWSDELLHFPLAWPVDAQCDDKLHMASESGALPSQLCDVVYHANGSLASATIWCLVSVQPEETLELRLQAGSNPGALPALSWKQQHDGYLAENDRCAVRVPASGRYAAADAPGPVLALGNPAGEWFGHGHVAVTQPLTVEITLREAGSLLLRWHYRAHYERRTLISVECTLFTGANFVHMREESSYDSDLSFEFDAFPGLEADGLVHHGGGEATWLALQDIDYGRHEELCVVDFHSGHQQMSNSWFGLYRQGAEPLLGVVEMQGHHWSNTSVNRLHLYANPPESLLIVSPWQGGVKAWALVLSTVAPNMKPANSRACIELSRIHQKYTEVPLQKLKEWVLDWQEIAPARPFLQCDAEGISRARAKVAASAELTRAYQAWAAAIEAGQSVSGSRASALATVWVALGDEEHARKAVAALTSEMTNAVNTVWEEGALLRLIIFHGRSMKMWLQVYDVLAAGGWIDEQLGKTLRRHFAFLAYGISDPEQFPKQYNLSDLLHPDAFFQGMGQYIGDAMCPPNFHTEYFTTYGMMGCCFPGHPMAAAWRDEGQQMMERMLEVHYYDSGAYSESPNYQSHSLVMLTQFALSLRRYGYDFFQHPRLKAQFEFFMRLMTPPILLNDQAREFIKPHRLLDIDRERYAMLPGNGNSGSDCSDMPLPVELTIAAVIYRESDPGLSARCMTAWRRGGRFIQNSYDDLTFLLLADIDLPGSDHLALQSEVLTGAYVTFRAQADTEDEVYVLTKNGTATHHNDFDEGGFTIWAYGAPVASDFGYHAHHEGRQYGVGDTWKHNCVEFDGKSSGYLGIEQTQPPQEFVSSALADLLVSDLTCTNFRDMAHMAYTDRIEIEPIEYRRYTLFVKPHYLLIFDSILSCPYAHRWWLHAQASDVRIDGPRAQFTGAFGIDLLAHFIAPAQPQLVAGEWGPMKHLSAGQSKARDWRVFVAPVKPGQSFSVAHAHAGRVVTVETPEYRDQIFLAHYPFHYADTGVSFAGRAGVVRRTADGQVQSQLLAGDELRVK